MLNKDGYPTNTTLSKVKKWKIKDYKDLLAMFEYIRENWWAADWGFSQESIDVDLEYGANESKAICKRQHTFRLSTGGWSGNEDMIRAMRENFLFWHMTWQVHRAGGHYEFMVQELEFIGKSPKS
jgi:hypothetical protein